MDGNQQLVYVSLSLVNVIETLLLLYVYISALLYKDAVNTSGNDVL